MGLLAFSFDTINRKLLPGSNSFDSFVLGTLYQEDILDLDIAALRPTGNLFAPFFERILLNGYDLRVSIGTPGVELAAVNSFALSDDGYRLLGQLNLNTTGINTLLATADASATFEVILSLGATVRHRTSQAIALKRSVYTAGSLVPPVSDSALGVLQADRTFARKEGRAGEGIILVSPDGTKKLFLYVDDDGVLQSPQIT